MCAKALIANLSNLASYQEVVKARHILSFNRKIAAQNTIKAALVYGILAGLIAITKGDALPSLFIIIMISPLIITLPYKWLKQGCGKVNMKDKIALHRSRVLLFALIFAAFIYFSHGVGIVLLLLLLRISPNFIYASFLALKAIYEGNKTKYLKRK